MSDSTREALRRWWWRQQFAPGWPGLLINPFFYARLGLLQQMRDLLPQLRGAVLDVGCGRKPYRQFVAAERYVGLDLDTPELRALGAADVFYSGERIPAGDGEFDAVLCSQVLEHIFAPNEFLAELRRVLRPGGRLLLTTPFVWDEHSQPHDFGRYSSFGLRHVLEQAGFRILELRKTCPDGRTLVQLASASLYKRVHGGSRAINLLAQLALIAPVNVLGGVLAAIGPRNPDFYLDNVVLAEAGPRPGAGAES